MQICFVSFADTSDAGCGCTAPPFCKITFDNADTVLRSPRFPSSYCPNQQLEVTITNPGRIHFSVFKLGAGTQLKVLDPYLRLYVFTYTNGIPNDIVTSDDKVTFVFITNDETDTGFEIDFKKGMPFDVSSVNI